LKIAIFNTLCNAFDFPFAGVPVGIVPKRSPRKRRVATDDEKNNDMFTHFDTIPACERQADKQTDILRQHTPRRALHRAVKIFWRCFFGRHYVVLCMQWTKLLDVLVVWLYHPPYTLYLS